MAKTPLMHTIRRLMRDARISKQTGIQAAELREMRDSRAITRRHFLAGTAAGAAALALPGRASAAGNRPSITIVGGGIAGLTCALHLQDKGYASTVYEASGRLGGRMFTNTTGYFAGNQVTEWGGELIDSGHHTIRNLAARFSLPIDNLFGAQPNGSRDIYRFDNQYYAATQADADFLDMVDIVDADLEAAPFPTTFRDFTPAGFELDHMSVHDWIETRVPGGHASPLGKLLDVAYAIEFGADSPVQSSLNLLYLLAFQPNANELAIFGESDEKFHIRGGNQQLPEAIAAALDPGAIKTSHRLVKLDRTAAGRCRATFARNASTVEVVSDFVVLALPFATLDGVDTTGAGFDARKRRAIRTLGRGHSGKLQIQFAHREWRGTGPWPGKSNGSSYSDTGYQATWDATRAQAGTPGILVLYSGGSVTDAMRSNSSFATTSDSCVVQDVQRGLLQLAPVYPGLDWNGKATESLFHKSPYAGLAYSYYKTGQYTDFGGHEFTRQGNVFFCGEHTTQEFQGYMEGGAITGKQAAKDLIAGL